jgi:hypothetical protein
LPAEVEEGADEFAIRECRHELSLPPKGRSVKALAAPLAAPRGGR